MSDILHGLARDPKSGAEIFMSTPPHILAALIDEGLAVVDMSHGRPAMKITDKGRVVVDIASANLAKLQGRQKRGVIGGARDNR